MMGPMEENDDGLGRATHSIRVLHKDMLLLLGLMSLLWLQYTHEGHMDRSVYDLFETKMHNIEGELEDILGRLVVARPPF